MDEIEQLLKELAGFLGGTSPVAGPPTPGTAVTPGTPGGPGTQGLLSTLFGGAGGGSSPFNLAQIFQIISALGGADLGTDQINQLKTLFANQNRAAAVAQNPAALARRTVQATLPVNKALLYNTTQDAEAAVANAGLAQSPGAVAGGVSRAVAPLYEQNLQLGNQMAEFGLPAGGFGAPYVPDYLSVLRELNQFGQGTGGGAYSLPAGVA